MDEWQRRYQGRCSFVCICCDGPDLAEAFAKRLRLTSCYNTVAAENPAWGQLGCSGFIVLDAAGNVTCKSTSAFLDVREQAFEHVLWLKSVSACWDGLEKLVTDIHPYDVPAMVAMPCSHVLAAYDDWLEDNTQAPSAAK